MKKYLYPKTDVQLLAVSQSILISPSIGGGVSGGGTDNYPGEGGGGGTGTPIGD